MSDDYGKESPISMPPREEAEEFYSRYELGEIIGQGTAVVRHCTHIETGQEYAVKIIDKSEDPEFSTHVIAEIQFLRLLDYHPHIVRLNDSFQTESHFFLVFELARCGELFELLTEKVFLPEDVARHYMRQIFAGVQHIHSNKIVHRDIKLENILMMEEDTLKISDFGFAASMPEDETLYELCGTPGYLAPEMIRAAMHKGDEAVTRGYSYKVDMWACGVILYTILVGFPPFWNSNRMVLMRLIVRGRFEFLSPYWDSVSDEAKDLVTRLLSVNPETRFTATEALQHPWMEPITGGMANDNAKILTFRVAVVCMLAKIRFARSKSGREPPMAPALTSPAPVRKMASLPPPHHEAPTPQPASRQPTPVSAALTYTTQ
eukprot:Ihof_evm23s10 gene=Ihof_evmTU23s10